MEKGKESVKELWRKYLVSIGEDKNTSKLEYTSWYFGNTREVAKKLADLVIKGEKKATTSLYCLYEIEKEDLPKENDISVITDFDGIAKCIIKTTTVKVVPFSEVDDEFAYTEGEGDKSLEYWRNVHKEVFNIYLEELDMKFTEDMLVVCEEFEVIYV